MNVLTTCIAALLAGITASLGLGGGMVLMIYLTIFAGIPQLSAQGINLIFFLPIAALSLIFHTKNKLVEWKKIFPSILFGIIGAVAGSLLADAIGSPVLRKIFAVFLILVGIKELLFKKKEKSS